MALPQTEAPLPNVFGQISDKGDCPAMAQAIRELHQIRGQENFPTQELAEVILLDPGLSTKILRVVNSAFFRMRGDPITTISRAVVLLGIDMVIDLASGILLVEQFDESDPALHDSLMESLRAALLARTLADLANLPNPEEAYLLGLFSNLGRLWLAAHYRDELARALERHAADAHSVEGAIRSHFGFLPEELAAKILERWGLPEKYSNFFRRHVDESARGTIEDRLVLVAELSTEQDDEQFVERVQEHLGLTEEKCRRLLNVIDEASSDQAEALGIGAGLPRRRRRRAKREPVAALSVHGATESSSESPSIEEAVSSGLEAAPVETAVEAHSTDRRRPDAAFGLQAAAEIARAIVEHEDLGPLLHEIVDGVVRAGGLDAAILYLADREKKQLIARLSSGEGIADHLEALAVPLSADGGLAAVTLLDRAPRVVEVASPALLVPAGIRPPEIPARSVATHPLVVRDRAIGALVGMRGGTPTLTSAILPTIQLFSHLAALAIDDRAR